MSLGDCIGKKFNRLIIVDEYRNTINSRIYCKCLCDCGNYKDMLKSNVIKGKSKTCGCSSKKYQNIKIGDKFGRLVVIEKLQERKNYNRYWLCKCDCGNYKKVLDINLKIGATKSCGCFNKENRIKNGKLNKKYNKYDLSGEHGIGYTTKGEEFYFDIEDYDLIKDYCWRINKDGYVVARSSVENKLILMHRIILGLDNNNDNEVDHINHVKNNNIKNNLRICLQKENLMNKPIFKNNTSKIIGVYFDKSKSKWRACIGMNKKNINIGTFENKKDAIIARLKAEKKYYGEFASQRHLFKEYGIGDEN